MHIPGLPPCIRFTAACAALLLSSLTLAAKDEVLLDFMHVNRDPDGTIFKCYQYTFGEWGGGKVIDLRGRGALIQAPGGKGGLGENKTLLKLKKTPVVHLVYLVGNANQARAINFSLTDKDGTEQSWAVPLADLPKGTEQRLRLDLSSPGSEQKPGKTPGLDLGRLESWQIRGDWGSSPVEVLVIKLVAEKK
jgi:hypothetical protein